MSFEPINIMPYNASSEPEILEIEKKLIQGKLVKLEMIRESYVSRAQVFRLHGSYLGYNEKGQLVGAVIGAKVPIKINGKVFSAGFGLDLCVTPSWKNKGAGKQLTRFVMKNFFYQHNLTKNFITLKASNNPMLRVGLNLLQQYSCIGFTCLVIPANSRMTTIPEFDQPVSFSTDLMEAHNKFTDYISYFKDGLCAWHTHKLYKVRITEIHPAARLATRIVSFLNNKQYPARGQEISTATLFNITEKNIVHTNQAFQHLEDCGVNYLNVVCQKHDPVYNAFKQYSIYVYDHYILADFNIDPADRIVIDVRCL